MSPISTRSCFEESLHCYRTPRSTVLHSWEKSDQNIRREFWSNARHWRHWKYHFYTIPAFGSGSGWIHWSENDSNSWRTLSSLRSVGNCSNGRLSDHALLHADVQGLKQQFSWLISIIYKLSSTDSDRRCIYLLLHWYRNEQWRWPALFHVTRVAKVYPGHIQDRSHIIKTAGATGLKRD